MIAISYRREDSLPVAGRLYDRLRTEFGKENVFMDFDSIPYGVDFREHIRQMIDQSKVLIALIGPEWTGKRKQRKKRIDEPTDFVRLEIAYAFARKIPVIPVLVDDTVMPDASELPSDIQEIAFRNAITLDVGIDFHHHADRLVGAINRLIIDASRATRNVEQKRRIETTAPVSAPPLIPISQKKKTVSDSPIPFRQESELLRGDKADKSVSLAPKPPPVHRETGRVRAAPSGIIRRQTMFVFWRGVQSHVRRRPITLVLTTLLIGLVVIAYVRLEGSRRLRQEPPFVGLAMKLRDDKTASAQPPVILPHVTPATKDAPPLTSPAAHSATASPLPTSKPDILRKDYSWSVTKGWLPTNPSDASSATPASAGSPVEPFARNDRTWQAWIGDFVRKFIFADANGNLNVAVFYAGSVDYFDNPVADTDSIRDDTEEYNRRWPKRYNTVDGEIRVSETVPEKQYAAKYQLTFYVESAERHEWSSGNATVDLDIVIIGEVPKIARIKQSISQRSKGKLGRASSSELLGREYPYAIAIQGKPGIVRSPYAPAKGQLDVHRYAKGTPIKCRYTGNIFIVP
jgi:hypothetical protein